MHIKKVHSRSLVVKYLSDLKNEAEYSAKSIGAAYHKYDNFENMSEDEQNKVYNTKGLAPNLSMPVKGDASSTTKIFPRRYLHHKRSIKLDDCIYA